MKENIGMYVSPTGFVGGTLEKRMKVSGDCPFITSEAIGREARQNDYKTHISSTYKSKNSQTQYSIVKKDEWKLV